MTLPLWQPGSGLIFAIWRLMQSRRTGKYRIENFVMILALLGSVL